MSQQDVTQNWRQRLETISPEAGRQLIGVLPARYRRGSKTDKGRILCEFVAVSGYHRKHAVRLPRLSPAPGTAQTVVSKRIDGEAVKEALTVIREAADRIGGKRLKAVIPQLGAAMEILGIIFLRFAEVRFALQRATLEKAAAKGGNGNLPRGLTLPQRGSSFLSVPFAEGNEERGNWIGAAFGGQ